MVSSASSFWTWFIHRGQFEQLVCLHMIKRASWRKCPHRHEMIKAKNVKAFHQTVLVTKRNVTASCFGASYCSQYIITDDILSSECELNNSKPFTADYENKTQTTGHHPDVHLRWLNPSPKCVKMVDMTFVFSQTTTYSRYQSDNEIEQSCKKVKFLQSSVGEVVSLAHHDWLILSIQNKQHLPSVLCLEQDEDPLLGGQLHTVMSMTATQSKDRILLYTTYWWLLP